MILTSGITFPKKFRPLQRLTHSLGLAACQLVL